MPLAGAYMADQYWGRFKTIQVSIGIALVGHVILIMSAIPPVIVNPKGSIACFTIGIVIMGMGVGGFKSNISPLIAEQCVYLPRTLCTPTNEYRYRDDNVYQDYRERRKTDHGSSSHNIKGISLFLSYD